MGIMIKLYPWVKGDVSYKNPYTKLPIHFLCNKCERDTINFAILSPRVREA
jgi:hypothetical protein